MIKTQDLEAQTWDLHTVSYATFYWPEQVTRPAQVEGVGEQIPSLNGKNFQVTRQEYVYRKENNAASFSNNLPSPFDEIQKATPGQFSAQERDDKDVEAEIRQCVGKIPKYTRRDTFVGGDRERWKQLSVKENEERFDSHCLITQGITRGNAE